MDSGRKNNTVNNIFCVSFADESVKTRNSDMTFVSGFRMPLSMVM